MLWIRNAKQIKRKSLDMSSSILFSFAAQYLVASARTVQRLLLHVQLSTYTYVVYNGICCVACTIIHHNARHRLSITFRTTDKRTNVKHEWLYCVIDVKCRFDQCSYRKRHFCLLLVRCIACAVAADAAASHILL